MDDAVEARDVSFAYDGVAALEGISLSIPEGSITALLGPNGAGKTTFVRLATGVLAPDAGTVEAFGTDPATLDRHRLGVLPQAFDPPERLTPGELARYYAGLYDRGADPPAVLESLDLEGVSDRQYRRLSGGEQRRCCLATALINEPDLLVLDEPTARIDPAGKRAIWSLLPELVAGGTTILLTTHDMAEADRLADRVAVFHEGALLAAGPTEEVTARHLGRRRLVVETDDPEGLVGALGRGADGDGRVVLADVDHAGLVDIVEAVLAADATVDGIHWERPPLEALVLGLTDDGGASG